jgi:hypothetical protein
MLNEITFYLLNYDKVCFPGRVLSNIVALGRCLNIKIQTSFAKKKKIQTWQQPYFGNRTAPTGL